MATTHLFAGLVVALPLVFAYPELAIPLAVAAGVGSVFPDFDILVGTHRKTLHYPVYYWVPTVGLLAGGIVSGSPALVLGGAFSLGAAQHSLSDVVGGGLERKPWEKTTSKAVYSRFHKRWYPPRHIIEYDGSPSDLGATILMSPVLLLYGVDTLTTGVLIAGMVTIAVGYTAVRKVLPQIEDFLYEKFPVLHPFLHGLHGQENGPSDE